MLYALLSLVSALVGVLGLAWYNSRRAARSESIADAEKQARLDATRRTEALETAAIKQEAEERQKDVSEGSKAIDSGTAGEYLVQSFPARPAKP